MPRTLTTIRADAPTTLEGLKKAYLDECDVQVEKYPKMAAWRDQARAQIGNARLGVMVRRFASKGDYTVLPVGAHVLVTEQHDDGDVTVFAPSIKGPANLSKMSASWVRIA